MASSPHLQDGDRCTFMAGATMGAHLRVKTDSSNHVVLAGVTDHAVGYIDERGATNGEYCGVRLNNAPTHAGVAAGALAVGALLYAAASGKVNDVDAGSAVIVGIAKTAAAADGDVIEFFPV